MSKCKEEERKLKHREAQKRYTKRKPISYHLSVIKHHQKKIEEILNNGEEENNE